MKINRIVMNCAKIAFLSTLPLMANPKIKLEISNDTFEYVDKVSNDFDVSTKGTTSVNVLKNAPSPSFNLGGKAKNAGVVVDLSKNILYRYNGNKAVMAYKVASGSKRTPTHTGIRVIKHVETYPYSTSYGTKRKRNPKDYGPKILYMEVVNPKTGETYCNGEFIHGNRNESSLGKYVSHGCIRMDNEVIVKLSKEIPMGTYVLVMKSE